MVKKRGIVWNYFNKKVDGSQVIAFCKFCDQSYIQNATRMERHLERCQKCPEEVRQQFIQVGRTKKIKMSVASHLSNPSSTVIIKKSDSWPNAESSMNQSNVTDTELEDLDEWGYRNQIYADGTQAPNQSVVELNVPASGQWSNDREADEVPETNGSNPERNWDGNRNEGDAEEDAEPQERQTVVNEHRHYLPRKISSYSLNSGRPVVHSSLQSRIYQEQLLERRAARRTAELELRRKTLELERSQWEYEREKAQSELRWAHEIRMMQLAEDRERQIIEENRIRASRVT